MSSNPIQSPSELGNMSIPELDLVAQAASASGFNPYDILYGPPSVSNVSTAGPRASTPVNRSTPDPSFSDSTLSLPPLPESPIPSPPPTPSPTPRPTRGRARRRGRGAKSLLNLARDQVRAQGINPMEFMVRPRRTASRPGGRGRITVPAISPAPARSPSPMPSSLDLSFGSNASSSRSSRGRPRRRRSGGGGGGGGGDSSGNNTSGGSSNTSRTRRNRRRQELLRELQQLQQDNIEKSRGRQIAGVTHTNTITTTYKDGGTPTVSRSSSRVSN